VNPRRRERVQRGVEGRLLALVASWLVAAAPAAGDAPAAPARECAERAVSALQRRYEAVRDLDARFEQTTRSVALGGPGATAKSSGQVVFAKPGRMRWSYEAPEPSLVVSDGKQLWIYDPANREVQRMVVSDGYLSGAALSFLVGQGEILRDFDVTALECGEASVLLDLVPRAPSTYERLRARTDPRSGELRETTVIDLLGNATTVALREVRVNRDPDPALFRFEAPPGVRVVEVDPGAAAR
jgi:outer membrane lipoprotein carrier protein